jgi:2-C-methyl-D-erythritol 4-phosphate cytidylyltransferase
MRTTAILVAAGEGRRIGGDVSKTYVPIAGRSLVLRTLDRIFSTPAINDVVLVIAPDDFERCETLLRGDLDISNRAWSLESGGATRQQSVQRGCLISVSLRRLIKVQRLWDCRRGIR